MTGAQADLRPWYQLNWAPSDQCQSISVAPNQIFTKSLYVWQKYIPTIGCDSEYEHILHRLLVRFGFSNPNLGLAGNPGRGADVPASWNFGHDVYGRWGVEDATLYYTDGWAFQAEWKHLMEVQLQAPAVSGDYYVYFVDHTQSFAPTLFHIQDDEAGGYGTGCLNLWDMGSSPSGCSVCPHPGAPNMWGFSLRVHVSSGGGGGCNPDCIEKPAAATTPTWGKIKQLYR